MSKFKEIVSSTTPTLVDFYATWCGPCQTMMPVLDQVKNKLGNGIRILKIDVDKNQQLAQQLHIEGLPTLKLFENGKEKWSSLGYITEEALKSKL